MVINSISAITAVIISALWVMHKNKQVAELQSCLDSMHKANCEDILKIIYEIRKEQDEAKCTSTHDGKIRKILNDYTEEYTSELKKIELNHNATNDKV